MANAKETCVHPATSKHVTYVTSHSFGRRTAYGRAMSRAALVRALHARRREQPHADACMRMRHGKKVAMKRPLSSLSRLCFSSFLFLAIVICCNETFVVVDASFSVSIATLYRCAAIQQVSIAMSVTTPAPPNYDEKKVSSYTLPEIAS